MLHKPPKQCRISYDDEFTVRQQYYYTASHKRYMETNDGKHISVITKTMGPELGRFDSVRFIPNP